MATDARLRDRARGCLLGLAVGDALGGPLEFMSAAEIEARHGGPVSELVGGGWLHLRPGQVTDDTEMALCLARSLAERGGYDPDDALKRYLDWYRSGPVDIGNATRAALSAAAAGRPVGEGTLEFHERSGGRSAGNGSLMRIAPLALAYRDRPADLMHTAEQDSRLTHHDPLAAEACALFCVVVAGKLVGHDLLELPARSEPLIEALRATPEDAAKRAAAETGFVLTALAVALAAYRSFESFEDGLVWAVNLGGDTDTNGAVAGALLGAVAGAEAIPARWLEQLESKHELVELADALLGAGPAVIDSGQEAALAPPSSDDRGDGEREERLPGDSYRVLPGLFAGPYPGAASKSEAERKLNAFLGLGISCFVDLTEEGEGPPLHPYAPFLRKLAKKQGLRVAHLRFSVVDLGVPADWQLRTIVAAVREAVIDNEQVYVHCWGGVGRTGTVVGCLLVELGASAADALAAIKRLRAGTERARRSVARDRRSARADRALGARAARGRHPSPDADWTEISRYAHLMDGYEHFGGRWGERFQVERERFERTGQLPDEVHDLRALLLLEFRSDRFSYGDDVTLVETEPGVHEVRPNPDYESTTSARYRRAIVARLGGLCRPDAGVSGARTLMRTVGIDLAAQDRNTAACVIEWTENGARVEPRPSASTMTRCSS